MEDTYVKLKAFVYRSSVLLAAAMFAAGCTKEAQLELTAPASASPWTRYAGWPDKHWDTFTTLAVDRSPPIGTPPKTEAPIEGDPKKGMELSFDRSRGGGCMACHVMGAQTPEQRYCSAPACQRERRRRWQREKRRRDPDYRENQRQAQRRWASHHREYWRGYRAEHPEYTAANRARQRERDRRRRVSLTALMEPPMFGVMEPGHGRRNRSTSRSP